MAAEGQTKPRYKNGIWCLITNGNRVLMMKRNKQPHQGLWIPPGGKVEVGESPIECAVREVKRETGLQVSDLKLRGILTEHSHYGFNWINFIYVTPKFSGKLIPELREGHLEWISIDNYPKLPTPEVDKLVVPKILSSLSFYEGRVEYNEDLHITNYKELMT